jgi:predicted TPR repeat methyltransferase
MTVNYSAYYNDHPDYIALRDRSSEFFRQYLNEVKYWKNKYLFELVKDKEIHSVCEIGCATGVLLAEFPSSTKAENRCGIDVSTDNIEIARVNYPGINFFAGYFEDYLSQTDARLKFDLIILSDILEHVEDDAGLLALAGKHADYVVLNLPLEKCGEFEGREYGLHDKHGHLRAYDAKDASDMVARAGLVEEHVIIKQYVLEPVFRKYLADKLFNNKPDQEKVSGIAKYINEINDIELNPAYYKSNYFGLLKKG